VSNAELNSQSGQQAKLPAEKNHDLQMSAAPEARVSCPVCREPIIAGARKCINCKSDLVGWRRYLSVSVPTLALITALISVIASSAPAIRSLFAPSDARMHLTFLGGGDRQPYREEVLLASNNGTKSGALTAARLHAAWRLNGKTHGVEFALFLPNGRPAIVQPGASIGTVLTIDPDYTLTDATSDADAQTFAVIAKEANWKTDPLKSMSCEISADLVYSAGIMFEDKLPARCDSVLLAMVSAFVNRGPPVQPRHE